MSLSNWLGLCKPTSAPRKSGLLRVGHTVAFEVSQDGNRVKITGEDVDLYFVVEGIDLPPEVDATFAVWAVLALAMENGFNVEINHPIDPEVAANAEKLSQLWEMWTPSRYRSVRVSGKGVWQRPKRARHPCLQMYSGGVDATYALLQNSDRDKRGHAATIFGFEYRDEADKPGFAKLLAKTAPLLDRLNCQRIVIDTNANRRPSSYTHGFTLAASLYLLSGLFEGGTIAADRTHAQDLVTFPWGTNHVINAYFNGSDFTVRSIGGDVSRTEKVAAIVEHKIDLSLLSFCRQKEAMPENCGVCKKCIRTKAMFLATTGRLPDIFVDNTFGAELMQKLHIKGHERTHVFDLYFYAKERDRLDLIPGLVDVVDHYRRKDLAV